MNLHDTNIVITGASRGLGRALALSLARAGARLVLVGRDPAPLDQTIADIEKHGGIAHAIYADVGDKQAIYAIAGQAAALLGPIDVLINNASTLGPTPLRLLSDTECEDFERVLQVNLLGPFRLTKVIAGSMALRRRGLVINISSDAAIETYATWGAYSVSKAALDHLSRIWAEELAEHGVRFLAIDPGEMNTRMHADAVPDADPTTLSDPAQVATAIVTRLSSGSWKDSPVRVEAAS